MAQEFERVIEPVPEPVPPPLPPPPPPPVSAPSTAAQPAGRGLAQVPVWVDQLADVFSWVATAWLIAQAASWLGKDNWIVALAMGAAAVALFPNFVEPVRRFLRGIIYEIFAAVAELITFLSQWLQAVAEHFQGNMLRAIIRIVALAAFMWIWTLARTIPVISNLIDLIVETAGKITAWVNQQVDGLVGQVLRLRDQVRAWVDGILAQLGDVGKAVRDDVLGLVNQLFNGVTRELNQLRFELLGRLDVVTAALRFEVEILGQRIRLVPQEVVGFLRERFNAGIREQDRALRNALAAAPALPMEAAAPWVVVEAAIAEVQADILQVTAVAGAQADPLEQELRRLVPQAPAYLRGWLSDQIDEGLTHMARQSATTAALVDQSIKDLRAVLAGKPPAIPDLPRELMPPPRPAPDEPGR